MSYFGILLAIAGVIVLIAALAQALQNRSYAACSEKMQVTVAQKTSRRVKNGRVYELYVNYNVNGIDYERWIGVGADEFNSV